MKKLFILAFIVLYGTSCNKSSKKPTCATQVCTDLFASITIHFTDSQGKAVEVSNYSAVNTRTGLRTGGAAANANLIAGYYIVADDTDLKNLSNDGDNIQVNATNPATNQTKTVTVKVAGGCTCHVSKVSGPDQVTFN